MPIYYIIIGYIQKIILTVYLKDFWWMCNSETGRQNSLRAKLNASDFTEITRKNDSNPTIPLKPTVPIHKNMEILQDDMLDETKQYHTVSYRRLSMTNIQKKGNTSKKCFYQNTTVMRQLQPELKQAYNYHSLMYWWSVIATLDTSQH